MPAPAAYLDITSVPYSRVITQAEFNAGTYGNVANEVWFRYIASAQVAFGNSVDQGGTFAPVLQFIAANGSTIIASYTGTGIKAWYNVASASTTYYLRITRNGGGASDFDFTVQADTGAVLTSVDVGNYIINDDEVNNPAFVLDATGAFVGILPSIPFGETGDALPTGENIWQDTSHSTGILTRSLLFDATSLALLATINVPFGTGAVGFGLYAHDATQFFHAVNDKIYTISSTGTLAGPVATVTGSPPYAIGVNSAGTILYYVTTAIDDSIHRWDLTNDVALSSFAIAGFNAGDGDYLARTGINGNPGEILALSDGSIVFDRYKGSDDTHHIIQMGSTGTVLQDWDFDTVDNVSEIKYQIVNHLHYSPVDSLAKVRVWLFNSTGRSGQFAEFTLADGTLSADFTTDLATARKNHNSGSEMFVPSSSCTMVTFGYPSPVEQDLSEPCCPCDCPTPTKDGTPARTPLPTHTGPIIPPVELTWDRNCSGGGTVPTASDPTDAESWVS